MDKLRIGVIGTGSLGTDHIERFTERIYNAEVTALYDVFPKEGKFAARYEKSYMDVANAKDVDAIILTTPNNTHEQIMMDLVKVGKPIFCEKPLTNTAEGCKRIIDEEMKASKPFIQVGFMRRFDPDYNVMYNELRKPDYLGKILMMHSQHRSGQGGIETKGPRIGGIKVEGTFEEVSKQTIPDGPIHDIDTCRWLMNDPDDHYESALTIWPIKSKYCTVSQRPAFYILKTKKGVMVTVESSGGFHGQYDINLEVVCDDGVINFPSFQQPRIRRDGKDGVSCPLNHLLRFKTAFDIELQKWVDGVLAGSYVNGASAWDAYINCCATDALARSIDSKDFEMCEFSETPSFYK